MDNSNILSSKRTPSEWKTSEALEEAVSKYITENPQKYRAAQQFGDFLTSHTLAQVDTFKIDQRDIAGQEIRYQELCKVMRYYGVKPKDMEEDEVILLQNKLGSTWKDVLIKEYEFIPDDFNE